MKTLDQLANLENQTALVTGGAGHIGLAICQSLMELGADVIVCDIDRKACDERVNDLNECGFIGQATALVCDLSKESNLKSAVKKAYLVHKRLDILIHNAAFVGTTKLAGWAVDLDKQSLTAWNKAMRINLDAAFVLSQEAKKYLTKSRNGSIIYISSIYGMVGPDMSLYKGTEMKNPVAYGASKAGLIQLAKSLATQYGSDTRVNVISPGGVARNQDKKFVSRYKERTPLKRMAKEEDLKGAVAYLASDLSKYVTGHNLVVDGGWTAW